MFVLLKTLCFLVLLRVRSVTVTVTINHKWDPLNSSAALHLDPLYKKPAFTQTHRQQGLDKKQLLQASEHIHLPERD